MECQICLEKYDLDGRTPHTLYPCSHTLCLLCINNLATKICPACRSHIKDNKPNFALIELIQNLNQSNRKQLDVLIKDLENLQTQLNQSFTSKLNEINDKSSRLRLTIQNRANQLIGEIDLIENEHSQNLKKLTTYDEYQINSKIRKAKREEQLDESELINLKQFFESNCAELNYKIKQINRVEFKNYEFIFGDIRSTNEVHFLLENLELA